MKNILKLFMTLALLTALIGCANHSSYPYGEEDHSYEPHQNHYYGIGYYSPGYWFNHNYYSDGELYRRSFASRSPFKNFYKNKYYRGPGYFSRNRNLGRSFSAKDSLKRRPTNNNQDRAPKNIDGDLRLRCNLC